MNGMNIFFGKEEVSNSLYIHRFAVKRKYKGNGIGEWMLQWIEENIQHDKEFFKTRLCRA